MLSNTALKKTIKLSGISGTIATIISVLFIAYGFYYNTTSTQEEQAQSLKDVKKDVVEIKQKINQSDVFQGVSQAEYTALKDKVTGIEKTVDKIDAKLDRVLMQTK